MAERKVMVGQRVRRLRQGRGLTQTQMAEQLGISASYLNLIERNQRPVTVQFLLRLGQAYDIDLVQFAGDDEGRVAAQLKEVFSDPLFARAGVSPQDIEDMAGASPAGGEAVFTLYKTYRDLAEGALQGVEQPAGEGQVTSPADAVADYLQSRDNYLPELEELAAEMRGDAEDAAPGAIDGSQPWVALLEARHGIKTRVMPVDVMEETLRRYDRHGRRVLLSEALAPEERSFQLAHQLALLTWADALDDMASQAAPTTGQTRRFFRVALADYAAGALLMPYDAFQHAARETRHDVAHLARRFGATREQVCLRLATLQRAGAKGVPLFVLQLDAAGNVLRRFSANGYHVPRFGGVCPRWLARLAGGSGIGEDGLPSRQVVEMPDGAAFLSFAYRTPRPGAGEAGQAPVLTTILGVEAGQAGLFQAADGLAVDGGALPIGPNCRLCERVECGHRSQPPLNRRLIVDENYHGYAPYFFT